MDQQLSGLSESFRATLASILSTGRNGDQSPVLVVTSAQPEGKTTVVSNLGIGLAEIGSKVLLIDGDMRRPRLHKVFDQANSWGLSDVLREKNAIEELPLDVLVKKTAVPGPLPATQRRLRGQYFRPLVVRPHGATAPALPPGIRLRAGRRAPCLEFADARIMARYADQLLLVVRANYTDRRTAQAAVQRLLLDGIPVMGVILNRCESDAKRYVPVRLLQRSRPARDSRDCKTITSGGHARLRAARISGPDWAPGRGTPDFLPAVAPVVSGLSLRSNFAWVAGRKRGVRGVPMGHDCRAGKIGQLVMVGQFSLGLAIATPVLMFTNLHLRAVQATDARRLYSFAEYLQLRTFMTLVAIAVIAGIACFENYERQTAMVILAVALAKGIETLSDIHYGLFQLNDRLDQTGTSMMLRGAFSVVALSAGLYLTRDIFWACVGLALVWLAALLLFDFRRGRRFVAFSEKCARSSSWKSFWRPENRAKGFRRQWNLMRLALPLGIVTTMASINLNMPRYFIEARMGVHQLGIFSALAYATVAITLVSDSLGHCAIPRMSRLYAAGKLAEFRSVLLQLSGIGGALGLAGLAVAKIMGTRLLTIFYSPEYAAGSRVFIVLMLATAIHCVAGMLTSGIMSARCFRIQVPVVWTRGGF